MNMTSRKNLVKFTQLALLTAIVFLMAFTPLGYFKTAGLEITFILIPVVVGANLLGPAAGAFLGLIFGITSFIQCFGFSQFGAALLAINPAYTFIVCIIPRVLCGWVAGLIYKMLSRFDKTKIAAALVSSLACPLLNTLLFMGSLLLFFWNTEFMQGISSTLGTGNVFAFVIAFVGINGLIETIVCCVVGTALTKPLSALNAKLNKNRGED